MEIINTEHNRAHRSLKENPSGLLFSRYEETNKARYICLQNMPRGEILKAPQKAPNRRDPNTIFYMGDNSYRYL